MITGLFICAWLVLSRAPETVLGRFLQHWMLDWPMARAARITRGQEILAILLAFLVSTALAVLKAEAGPLLGLATPASPRATNSEAANLQTSQTYRSGNQQRPGDDVQPRGHFKTGEQHADFDHRASATYRSKRAPANDDDRPALTA